mmetsp:Transcript_3566/g.3457  ORF Transcript_3566/g.3457 Transcript_3566/m.3457 type:complete len:92 (-) Transcript_3566:214-489(-)
MDHHPATVYSFHFELEGDDHHDEKSPIMQEDLDFATTMLNYNNRRSFQGASHSVRVGVKYNDSLPDEGYRITCTSSEMCQCKTFIFVQNIS